MAKRGASWRYALNDDQVVTLLFEAPTLEDRLMLKLMAYLGMRVSEVCHMKASWIEQGEIRIPPSQPCDCVNCQQERKNKPKGFWYAKTKKSVRDLPIPNAISDDLYQYFHDRPQGLSITRQALWHRIKHIGKKAKIVEKGVSGNTTFSHALRATAATMFVKKGMNNAAALCYIMGWSDIKTAQSYIDLVQSKDLAHQKLKDILG